MIRIAITDGTGRIDDPAAIKADFLQIREPNLTTRELASLVEHAVKTFSGRVLVNDRLDVALACGAAGVHLRSGSVSSDIVRRIAPPNFIVMVACHDANDVRRAEREVADYAILAPVFAPLSKVSTRPPLGLEALGDICKAARIPVIALGGVTEANTPLCLDAGAAGIAGISLFRRS